MRIRSIKPEFYRSEDIGALSWEARLLFIGLWSYVDDNGVGRDVERLIVADIFPLDEDVSDTLARVSRGLLQLAEQGLIVRYVSEGKPYLYVTGWAKHQRIDKPNAGRYPLPDQGFRDGVAKPREGVAKVPRPEQRNRGTEEQRNRGSAARRGTRLPSDWQPDDLLLAYARSKAPSVDVGVEAEKFVNYWTAKAGAQAVKLDWGATFRNWVLRAHQDSVNRGWVASVVEPVDGLEWMHR